MKIHLRLFLFFFVVTLGFVGSAYRPFDEGMFPLDQVSRLDLKKAGLRISPDEIYNADKPSLVNALVKVGGCTGSFVSPDGLIITNHHCAFSAVQAASTPDKDFLNNGFVARTREQEIEAKGLTCRITDSYEDVSAKVLDGLSSVTDPALRIKSIEERMETLAAEAEKADTTITAEVSEMFAGKSYILFRYKTIRDVRLVYVPRRSIGEFGGETDNWVWPRHTGDFSFMRAYVAPDGTSATYSKANVPYKPKRFLRVNPRGVNEEDFVFILGYPGRTFRNRPASYLQYQQQYLLPYIADLYEYENQALENEGKGDPAAALKLATRIKRNANVLKNYRGKLKGLNALNLVEQKRNEEQELAKFIQADPAMQSQYGSLLGDINSLYTAIGADAPRDLWLSQIYPAVNLLSVAKQLNTFKTALAALPVSQQDAFFKNNIQKLESSLRALYESFDLQADQKILKRMLADASELPASKRITAVDRQVLKGFNKEDQINKYTSGAFQYTRLKDANYVLGTLLRSRKALMDYNDLILNFERELGSQIASLRTQQDVREGTLNKLMADYVTVKELYQKKDFLPDANSTLRLTYGHVRGYSPADGSYMKPFTTIKGIFEKGSTGLEDYRYPDQIKALWEAKDFGPFMKQDLGDVPVGLLYDTDTSGGNSGSPVLNADGELVAVNFDRVYEATINDFAWNESYSRSIGVDIRYVLWVAGKLDQADFILKEMGVI